MNIDKRDFEQRIESVRISYRDRKRLRYVLYEAEISLIGKNAEFREIYEYY